MSARKEVFREILAERGVLGTILVFTLGPIFAIITIFGWCFKVFGEELMKVSKWDYR